MWLAFDAYIVLMRLDERIARSPVGQGWIARSHFADACVSLWNDGELVHLEDLVIHDATRDSRTPTHGLTIARDIWRTSRRIPANHRSGRCQPMVFESCDKRWTSVRLEPSG